MGACSRWSSTRTPEPEPRADAGTSTQRIPHSERSSTHDRPRPDTLATRPHDYHRGLTALPYRRPHGSEAARGQVDPAGLEPTTDAV